jgi:hypothetical protein
MPKNEDGSKGPICNNCGGYGFTNTLTGGSFGCKECDQTGIALPSKREMLEKIEALQRQLDNQAKP